MKFMQRLMVKTTIRKNTNLTDTDTEFIYRQYCSIVGKIKRGKQFSIRTKKYVVIFFSHFPQNPL